jgi:hypothetical protein
MQFILIKRMFAVITRDKTELWYKSYFRRSKIHARCDVEYHCKHAKTFRFNCENEPKS